jgi:hypothetical protein
METFKIQIMYTFLNIRSTKIKTLNYSKYKPMYLKSYYSFIFCSIY